jgi:hypothetical protein
VEKIHGTCFLHEPVPNQTPEKTFDLFRRRVAKINPPVKVECDGLLHPFKGWSTGPYVEPMTGRGDR